MSKGFSRRQFLKTLAATTCGAAVHRLSSPWGGLAAYAAPPSMRAAGPQPFVILINMAGGASYNIAPIFNGVYRDRNKNISYGPDGTTPALTLTGQYSADQGLHPSLVGLKTIYDEGNMALLNLVGYPNPNRSHDESTLIWFRGSRNKAVEGWSSRLTCQLASTFGGVSLGGANLLTTGDCNAPRAYGNLTNFGENTFGNTEQTRWLRDTRLTLAGLDGGPSNVSNKHVRESANSFERSIDMIKAETTVTPPGTFPTNGFGNACRDAAKLVMSPNLGVQFIYLEIGGFDTHSDERGRLTSLMTSLNGGLTALADSLKTMGRWGDAMIITMSEFSRTFENGSMGTDHGHAGPMFIIGGRVKGGIKTEPPTAAETIGVRNYYHQYRVDFREPLAAAVVSMGLNVQQVFPDYSRTGALDLFL